MQLLNACVDTGNSVQVYVTMCAGRYLRLSTIIILFALACNMT